MANSDAIRNMLTPKGIRFTIIHTVLRIANDGSVEAMFHVIIHKATSIAEKWQSEQLMVTGLPQGHDRI